VFGANGESNINPLETRFKYRMKYWWPGLLGIRLEVKRHETRLSVNGVPSDLRTHMWVMSTELLDF
jgi:hypothetical protein